jgi:hypothetical protein
MYMHTYALSCLNVYAKIGVVVPIGICTHEHIFARRGDHAHTCMHTSAIMPTRVCTHRRNHAHACLHTQAQSSPRVSAHTGAIMPTHVCTHRRDHAHVCLHTQAQSCLRMSAHICAIMPTRVCKIKLELQHSFQSRARVAELKSVCACMCVCLCVMQSLRRGASQFSMMQNRIQPIIGECDVPLT